MTIVPDTNLFYGRGTDLADLVSSSGGTISPSLVSALELLCAESDAGLPRRQQAAQNWLQYSGNAVIDNEIAHAVALGFTLPPDYISAFVTVLERFVTLPDTSKESQAKAGLDLSAAVLAKDGVSARFVAKVDALFGAYRSQVAAAEQRYGNRIPHSVSHEESIVRRIVTHFRSNIEDVHFRRIDDLATELALQGSNSRDASKIRHYVDIYLEFLVRKIAEGSPHINDYVDLQFFAYLDLGYTFASKEKKWRELADLAGKTSNFIFVP